MGHILGPFRRFVFYRDRKAGRFNQYVRMGVQSFFVAPDESYLIFTSEDRLSGQSGMNLYIGFHQPMGTWTEPRNMESTINASGVEVFASTSLDGHNLFFASGRNGNVDIYWVEAAVIERLRPDGIK